MHAGLQRLISIAPVLLTGLLSAGVAGAADTGADGVSALVVTYHVAPASRPAFRQELETSGIQLFRRWQEQGILKSFRVLFSRYADSDNWDAMALLTFPSYAGIERWKMLEQTTPAGLPQKALALVTAVHTTPVDLARGKTAAEGPGNPVFVVIPYVALVSSGDYLKYADDYVIPQFDGWMAEGVLSQYSLFVGSFPAGRPWSSMVILEYRDEAALAMRSAVVAKVRGRLKDIPEWKAVSDNKKSVRDEKQVVIADQIGLR
ncbi:MAG: hypothetical protein NT159_23380 [Proteobacteria bacterium]|nr:hypothetical protein [Pseudomonadota bacterium]